MAMKVFLVVAIIFYFGGMNALEANQTGDSSSNVTLSRAFPKVHQRENVKPIPIEEPILQTHNPPPQQDHGLMAGLIVPIAPEGIRLRGSHEFVLITPKHKTLGVLKGPLIPVPAQPNPIRPEPADGQEKTNRSIDITDETNAAQKEIVESGRKDDIKKEPLIHLDTPPQDIKHIDGLLAGLLVQAPELIRIRKDPHIITTPGVPEVVSGLLNPPPLKHVPISPKPSAELPAPELIPIGEELPPREIAGVVRGLLNPPPFKPVPISQKPPPELPAPELTTPEVAGVIRGLLNPPTFKPVPISPKPPSGLPNDTGIETMNAATEKINTMAGPVNFSQTGLNSSQDIFLDNTLISVNGKTYTLAYVEQAHTFGTRMRADKVYEYVYPIIIGIALMTMLFLVYVLSMKLRTTTLEMSKASLVLLIAVAIADILTMVFSVAEIAFMFSETRKNSNTMPYDNCRTMLILERLSAIPHVASTWITVVLAFQRFICVSKPFSAGNYITVKSSLICILCVSVLSVAMHICRFIDKTFEQISVIHQEHNTTIQTCMDAYAKWVKDPTTYESTFAWTRICLAQFIPSILIVIFVTSMIISMRKITMRSMHMQTGDSKMYSERRQLGLFVAVIAFIVFTVEMASGIFLSFNAWEITTGHKIFSYESLRSASIAFDLILYISYFSIFLIYCLMSEEIRNNILSVFLKMKVRDKTLHTHSGSGATASSDDSKQSTSQTFTSGSGNN